MSQLNAFLLVPQAVLKKITPHRDFHPNPSNQLWSMKNPEKP
jgi:hypothetical protein